MQEADSDNGSKVKMKMKKGCRTRWLCIGGSILLGLTAVAGLLYVVQDFIVFQPNAIPLVDDMPKVPHENVYIHTRDGVKLNLLLLPYKERDSSSALITILYFHGNAGSIYDRVFNALQMLVKLKANVVLVEYRGFGKSEGWPSEEGLYLDAEASLDFVLARPDLNHTAVVLFGRSLGGAVAVRLASVNPHGRVAAIIVENTFLSIPDMAASLFLPMRLLPLWYYKHQFLSYQHVALCHMPSLFVSGLADRLIPPVQMKQLYELSPAKMKRLATFPGGTHMNTRIIPGYWPAMEQFVADMLKSHALEETTGQTSALLSNSSEILT